MPKLQEYKCPCCGGAISFDSAIQKMKCPYCDTEFEMDTLKAYDADLATSKPDDLTWQSKPENEWDDSEADGLRTYVCNSCGGEIVGDANTAATSCPFCGNPVVMMGQLSGMLKPDIVIPFKLDKAAAKEKLLKHYEGKRLMPKVFKDENRIEEIKGIYIPFWLFDADVEAGMRFKATRVRTWSDSRYRYTETSYYSVIREGTLGFSDVPVDGSTSAADDLMESIEPFDLSAAVDFQTAYLAGYFADKYDVSAEQSIERANDRIKTSTENLFRDTVNGYSSVLTEDSNVTLSNSHAKYALFPVWLLTTRWKDQSYTFAMNGQTGKFVGNLPVDKAAAARWFIGTFVASGAIFYGLAQLINYLF